VIFIPKLQTSSIPSTILSHHHITSTSDLSSFYCYRLESPTRSLVMEAPKGVIIDAEAGNLEATCRTELKLESKDGEVSRRTYVYHTPEFHSGFPLKVLKSKKLNKQINNTPHCVLLLIYLFFPLSLPIQITLEAANIKLPRLPQGSYSPSGSGQKAYELCVCPNGRLFLTQAGSSSTCQIKTSVCL
ncbi:hypothetical protein JD844_012333, partial [Phrynosoma platyrhinos]